MHGRGLRVRQSRGAGLSLRVSLALAMACLQVFAAGCVRDPFRGMEGGGPIMSRVVSRSREVLVSPWDLPNTPPRFPAEPGELRESPEPRTRKTFIEEQPTATPGFLAAGWLPRGEAETMRRYMRLLDAGQGPSRSMLARIRRELPMILETFREYDLPPELALLPVVESRFESRAVSVAGAAGLWQLMPDTAQRFGLKVSDKEDERFDMRKSTTAAAAYLSELYRLFENWPLALAAYNCGEGALARAMERTGAGTLSELTAACRIRGKSSRHLSAETLDYVPKFAGAVHVLAAQTDLAGLICPANGDAGQAGPGVRSSGGLQDGPPQDAGSTMRTIDVVFEDSL